VLIVILVNTSSLSLGISRYVGYMDGLYGNNIPHHTFIDGVNCG